MKNYICHNCGHEIFFQNFKCLRCELSLGFLPDALLMTSLHAAGDNLWRPSNIRMSNRLYRMCRNYTEKDVCNWMVHAEEGDGYCLACRLNQVIPDLSDPWNWRCWYKLELAKRRALYGLLNLSLPLKSKQEDPDNGLAFAFLADPEPSFRTSEKIVTGHLHGLITINIAEADDAVREKHRLAMNEVYRTLLGHFRHETGHYYWEQLIHHGAWLEPYRKLFGDERQDYNKAISRHYAEGPPPDWQENFVSAYAGSHPWEDWAETWAHYLHVTDTLETTEQFGLEIRKYQVDKAGDAPHAVAFNHDVSSFEKLIDKWIHLTFALNSISRSMGLQDLYPFILSARVREKLKFVHEVIRDAREG